MGDSTFEGWQFRGQRVIQSVLTELVDTHGLGSGLAGTDTLIFGGASAGGKSCSGVFDSFDSIAPCIPISLFAALFFITQDEWCIWIISLHSLIFLSLLLSLFFYFL